MCSLKKREQNQFVLRIYIHKATLFKQKQAAKTIIKMVGKGVYRTY